MNMTEWQDREIQKLKEQNQKIIEALEEIQKEANKAPQVYDYETVLFNIQTILGTKAQQALDEVNNNE